MKIWESARKCPQLHGQKFGEYVRMAIFWARPEPGTPNGDPTQ